MRSVRFDRLLAGSALGLVLALSSYGASAQVDEAKIEAAMPAVDSADLPPPTIKDIGPVPATTAPAAAQTDSADTTQSTGESPKATAAQTEQPAAVETAPEPPKAAEADTGKDKA
ncbi:MAG TPA: hypothetical protein VFX37_13255, partial [Pseudolabrys sp.]|nr:hypothetical protein [Pseudolabrys sp.]